MNNPDPSGQVKTAISPPRGFSTDSLARAIFRAELPDEVLRSLPAQALHLVIAKNGLTESGDLLQSVSSEQCRLLLDFDLWGGSEDGSDALDEERLWEWLSLADDDSGLTLLQQIVKCLDLKIVGLLICRYVETVIFEESTDAPPGPEFYSPDRGRTWIHVHGLDDTKQFLLNRLLALLFETNADLFFQLLSIPSVATPAPLQEEAYQDRTKRLVAEGVPEPEFAHQICAPLDQRSLVQLLEKSKKRPAIGGVAAIEPLVYSSGVLQPLQRFIADVPDQGELEAELTLIMNASIVSWQVAYSDVAAVTELMEQVRGIINIGLEALDQHEDGNPIEVYNRIGLQPIFRRGLAEVLHLRKCAQRAALPEDPAEGMIVAALRRPLPMIPTWLDGAGAIQAPEGKLEATLRPITHLNEIKQLAARLT